jgi:competence protein ComEC
MRYYYLCFGCGIGLFQLMPHVPSSALYSALCPLLLSAWKNPRSRFVVLLGTGFLWAMFRAGLALGSRLPTHLAGQVLTVRGAVAQLSVSNQRASRFDLTNIDASTYRGQAVRLAKLKLAWYGAEAPLKVGAICSLKVRLRLPLGTHNPGVFDREKWLFAERVSALGHVIDHPGNVCDEELPSWHPSQIRDAVKNKIAHALAGSEQRAIILALGVADRSALSDEHWRVLAATGTAHLFAISGLHISLVAAAALLLSHWMIGVISPLARLWPVQRPAIIVAICAAGAYAALAGFPISAQRALIMLVVALGSLFLRRRAISLDSYCMAFALVAAIDPLSLLSASFWLSFCAVGWLLLITTTRAEPSGLLRLIRLHLFLALGLTPLLGVLHQSIPCASPLANLIAVPVVAIAIVPLVILGIAVSPFSIDAAALIWKIAASVWQPLWLFLQWLAANVAPIELAARPSWLAAAMAFVGVGLVLIPVLRTRWVAAGVLLAAIASARQPDLGLGELRVTVLDVGQGLATVIQTAEHVLVYDTGPSFGDYSACASIVAPFLHTRGVEQIDRIVISHADSDHAGGWGGLVGVVPARDFVVSPAHDFPLAHTDCEDGRSWNWDGVHFAFLYPAKGSVGSKNDLSCVLLISAPGGRILLPGDIERGAEIKLLNAYRDALSVDIVIAPHHGSSTSSTLQFIAAANPSYVVFATGFANRFDFPHREIVSRYLKSRAIVLNTGTDGAVEFDINQRVSKPQTSRSTNQRYWQQRLVRQPKG